MDQASSFADGTGSGSDQNPDLDAPGDKGQITQLLRDWQEAVARERQHSEQKSSSAETHRPVASELESKLADQIYPVLRRLAGRELRSWPSNTSLFATEVANEAYLTLVSQNRTNWQNRLHFFAIAARIMRRILVGHERKRRALKRGGNLEKVQLLDIDEPTEALDIDLLALDQALSSLSETNSRAAQVIELRCFGGLTQEETATALGISRSTVVNSFRFGRAWLHRALFDAAHQGS